MPKLLMANSRFILKTGQSDAALPAFRADEFLKYLSGQAQKEDLILK